MTMVVHPDGARPQGLTLGDMPDRRRLRAAMVRVNPLAFRTVTQDGTVTENDALHDDYVEMFQNLLNDAVVLPGFGTAQEMLLERIAWLWTAQKAEDQSADGVHPIRYQKLTTQFLAAMRTLFKARETADANDAFKRAFATQVFAGVSTALRSTIHDDEALVDRVLREVLIQLRAVIDANTARTG